MIARNRSRRSPQSISPPLSAQHRGAAYHARRSCHGMERGALERDYRAQAEYRGIANLSPRRVGVGDAAAGAEDVLEIRLQLPPCGRLVLVADLHQLFARAHRKAGRHRGRIAVERTRPAADPRVGEADAHRVIAAAERPLKREPGIEVEIDEVAVTR